ncbi:hypothetical protein N7478_010121 [Penicillium angulare]|uniref:uncharacterized protein n=1 Tax=Penicillium angulare TaxID=116970 RepID=UPI0025406F96|nr:uncharacterized protein N7478_010121 [Penicillium angulare]KAJ5267313.1 hypothetical protein N7478_010121 [Penicillium angulare]
MHTARLLAVALLSIIVPTPVWADGSSGNSFSQEAHGRKISGCQGYASAGFGQRTLPIGSGDNYRGNVGIPYGSNIIEIPAHAADDYRHVVQFNGVPGDSWTVVIWNKYGPDGVMNGWFGNACHDFHLTGSQTRFFAFDGDSQGGWAAARGSHIPLDTNGGYATTWGEFDFGSRINLGWSGFDVSAIAAQSAQLDVQGMKICDAVTGVCSSVSKSAARIENAYTFATRYENGIGGNLAPGPVRLQVWIDYVDRDTRDEIH